MSRGKLSLVYFLLCSFLNDVTRIAQRDYEPSDSDIVRARLRTLGVQEHHLKFETGERSSSTPFDIATINMHTSPCGRPEPR